MLLEKNDVIMGDGECLTDGALTKSPRASNILNAYQFSNEIVRQSMTVDFAGRMGSGDQDREFRENISVYLRTVGSQLQNEFNEHNNRL